MGVVFVSTRFELAAGSRWWGIVGRSVAAMTALRVVRGFVTIALVTFGLVLSHSETAGAHRPLFAGNDGIDINSAVRIGDPAVSYVIYLELVENVPYRWIVLDNETPRRIPLQLGAPAKSDWESADPVVVMFGPGLPEGTNPLPIEPPEDREERGDREGSEGGGGPDRVDGGTANVRDSVEVGRAHSNSGVIALHTGQSTTSFYEPVTGTTSRILIDTEVALPERGTYYVVVYDREGRGGKFWLGVGEQENFGWRDVVRLPAWVRDVRHFHGTGGWPRWMWGFTGIVLATPMGIGWWRRRRGSQGR